MGLKMTDISVKGKNGNYQIQSDGRTVWINSPRGVCVARFSKMGIDMHHDVEGQAKGSHCIDSRPGPTTKEDWKHFKTGVEEHYGVVIDEDYIEF